MERQMKLRLGIALGMGVLTTALAWGVLARESERANPPSMDMRRHDLQEPLKVGFLKPGAKLVMARRAGLMPAHWDCFLLTDNSSRLIRGPADLAGLVAVRSKRAALEYARFFPSTAGPSADWSELTHARDLADRPFIPNQDTPEELRRAAKGGRLQERLDGVLSDAEWRANKLTAPDVRQTEHGYTVTRWLWTANRRIGWLTGTDAVSLVTHTIRWDGEVTGRVLRRKKLRGVVIVVRPRM